MLRAQSVPAAKRTCGVCAAPGVAVMSAASAARAVAASHILMQRRYVISGASSTGPHMPIMQIVNCCNPRGCDDFFGGKFARRVAARYRKRGLDKTASRIVAFLEREGRRGRDRARDRRRGRRDPARAAQARRHQRRQPRALARLRRRGARPPARGRDRSCARRPAAPRHRRGPRQASSPPTSSCCTGWCAATPTTSGCSARRRSVRGACSCSAIRRATSPPARSSASQNLGLRLGGKEFRTFAHPPEAMLGVCRAHGLSPAYAHAGAVWQVEGLSR